MEKYDALKLEKQLCFPLYAVSKEIVKKYKPYLDELDLTYTQYITMMVMWEHKEMNVKELGEHLYLDSGTLTPVLKKLEQKGWVKRNRAKEDERVLIVTLTAEGERLRDKAVEIPQKVGGCVCLDQEEAASLYKILYKIILFNYFFVKYSKIYFMCNLCYKHMFAIIVAVSNNFHIMYIKDGKEKYISNVLAINFYTLAN